MSFYKSTCQQCGSAFTAERSDAVFCSGACKAAYERLHPFQKPLHADLPRWEFGFCENCGKEYSYNAYAERKGQREPKYCSNKCRQAAWRERAKGTSQQATGAKGKTRKATGAKGTSQQNQQNTPPPPPPPPPPKKKVFRYWWEVLGVQSNATLKDIKDAYRAMSLKYHPDFNKSSDALERMQEINAAYTSANPRPKQTKR